MGIETRRGCEGIEGGKENRTCPEEGYRRNIAVKASQPPPTVATACGAISGARAAHMPPGTRVERRARRFPRWWPPRS